MCKLYLIFITVLILISLLWLSNNTLFEQSGSGYGQLPHSSFINFNLTNKPLGHEHSVCSGKYLSKKYPITNNQFTDYDISKIPNSMINWDYHSYDNSYYHNPGLYCLNNPHFRLCPNHWL